ncbi:MAG: SDR family NAD(P)-dependent oxidoreductase [Planctomycetota bacterium]|nr:MAG: SDR family NAD(P)-dependent oxidoreductase [Planctomycetota bacterium]
MESNLNLEGKTAVITGASRGIGLGMAQVFQQHGMRLGLCARGEIPLQGSDLLCRSLDVAQPGAIADFCQEVEDAHGTIDLWVNNAGVLSPIAPLRKVSRQEWDGHLAVNLGGVFEGSRAYVLHLHRRKARGCLINLSSGAAANAYPGWSAYCAGKAAVERMSQCLQQEEGDRVRVFSLAPGVVDTDMQTLIRGASKEDFPPVDKFLELKEKQAFNSPEFVAEGILLLAFGDSSQDHVVATALPYHPG